MKISSYALNIHLMHSMVHAVSITLVVHMLAHAYACKNIIDLAHTDGGKSRLLQSIQKCPRRRLQGEIVAVGGSLEAAGLTHKGPGDHTAYAVLACQ